MRRACPASTTRSSGRCSTTPPRTATSPPTARDLAPAKRGARVRGAAPGSLLGMSSRRPWLPAPATAYDRPVEGYDPDLDRARQDRLSSTGGLASVAYWMVRGVTLFFGFVARTSRRRSGRSLV